MRSFTKASLLLLCRSSLAFHFQKQVGRWARHTVSPNSWTSESRTSQLARSSFNNDYLTSLAQEESEPEPLQLPPVGAANGEAPLPVPNGDAAPSGGMEVLPKTEAVDEDTTVIKFSHAPITNFAIDQLTPKGPRKNADVGAPHDSTRKLATMGPLSSGSWWCATGGWPSLTQRATTEIFYVFSGHGCVTDLDGTEHFFGPGDTVILPKGWSGRWDVLQNIHKVWFVHDHPTIEETSVPIRAKVTHYKSLAFHNLVPEGVLTNAIFGAPSSSSLTLYDVGPTNVGFWTCTPGSFPIVNRDKTVGFHVLEGVFFLTNADGTARRCQAGDTVVLPPGWSGYWDILQTVKKLWVVV